MDRFYLILLGIISTIGIIGIAICLIMAVIDDREYSIYDDYEYDGNDRVQEDKMIEIIAMFIAIIIVAILAWLVATECANCGGTNSVDDDRVQEDKMDGLGLLLIALGLVAILVAIRSL